MTAAIVLAAAVSALVADRILETRPWAWFVVRDTGVHVYEEHPDGRRRVRRRRGGGYQPVDRRWERPRARSR